MSEQGNRQSGVVKELEEKLANIGKPSVFIGSSRESIDIAEKVKANFPKEQFQVDLWSDGIFGKTRSSEGGGLSNMEWLKNFTDIYDFAIFIFVPEDEIVSRTRFDMEGGEARKAFVTRHNVVFEFGMFLGRVGVKRSFILFDEATRDFVDLFFTDLKENLDDRATNIEVNADFRIELYPYKGQTQPAFASETAPPPEGTLSIEAAIEAIKTQIIRNFDEIEIGFLPAVSLAIGYYNNFLRFFVKNVNAFKANDAYPEIWNGMGLSRDSLDQFRGIIQGAKNIKLKVVIPTSIEGARQKEFIPHFDKNRFAAVSFPGESRCITFKNLIAKEKKANEWIIYDVPTTLNSSIEAIDLITKHPEIRELLKEKELRNFRKSLESKIDLGKKVDETSNIDDLVEFISFDQFLEETK